MPRGNLYQTVAAALGGAAILVGIALTSSVVERPHPRHRPPAAVPRPAGKPALLPIAAAPPAPAAPAQPPPLAFSTAFLAGHPSPDLGTAMQAGIVLDLDTKQVIWEQGSHARRAPASLTKIMTVMTALDHAPLLQPLTVPPEAVVQGDEQTAMGAAAGETFTLRELLYGIFLVSANDAAETMARDIMPRDKFIAAMNAKADFLQLEDTHFENPTGLDQDGHYSSAYDLAVMTGMLELKYPAPVAIAALPQVSLYATDGHPEYDMVSLNKLLLWPYPGATGLKTGYTYAAGGCVAAVAARDGHTLIAVVLGSDVMFTDATKLFDYGFSTGA